MTDMPTRLRYEAINANTPELRLFLEQVAEEMERLENLTYCGCGDQFTTHDPGTCGTCCFVEGLSASTPTDSQTSG